MKYHLFRYLYGFEEYCRSANIQFRTIHHHEPKVKEEKKDLEESMEEAPKVDQEMPLVEVLAEFVTAKTAPLTSTNSARTNCFFIIITSPFKP